VRVSKLSDCCFLAISYRKVLELSTTSDGFVDKQIKIHRIITYIQRISITRLCTYLYVVIFTLN
jgi:hypothetical protein